MTWKPLVHTRSLAQCSTLRIVVVAAGLALVACATPPIGSAPPVQVPGAFRESGPTDALDGPDPGLGWQLFGDPQLDAWLQRARHGNPGLAQAAARVARAAAALGVQAADGRPQLAGNLALTRQMGPLVNAAGTQGNLFSAGLRLTWDTDLMQRLSRRQQAAWLDLQTRQLLQQQARLMLEAEVVQAYLAWRGVHAELRSVEATLHADRALVAMADRRLRAGLVAADVRGAALAEQWADEAEAQTLARRRALVEHALLALAGGEDDTTPPIDAAAAPDMPAVVPTVPAGLPSHLLQRRPDVNAAAHAVQAARVRLGLARDAWFPTLTLTTTAGLASGELGQWLRAASRSTGLGLLLGLPLLDGGRADAERAAAEADLQLATAAHRDRVVQALREVEDHLATLRTLAHEAEARREAADEATREADRVQGLWQRGLRGEADAVQAVRSAERARRRWLQVQSARHEATAGLVRALGGGWGASGTVGTTPGAAQPASPGASPSATPSIVARGSATD